jgi:hypothetical protein
MGGSETLHSAASMWNGSEIRMEKYALNTNKKINILENASNLNSYYFRYS